MSLQGTGSTTEYWSGALTGVSRPFTIGCWYLTTAGAAAGSSQEVMVESTDWYNINTNNFNTTSSTAELRDGILGTEADVTANLGTTSSNTWYFLVFIFDVVSGTNEVVANAGTPTTGAATSSSDTFASPSLFLAGGGGGYTQTYDCFGEVTLWTGKLSTTDISNLYNGGSGGKGVNPTKLTSTSGASLLRYYLPVGGADDFADHSGKGGATLAAQGGATPTWNASDPPVNLASGGSAFVPPLIVWMA